MEKEKEFWLPEFEEWLDKEIKSANPYYKKQLEETKRTYGSDMEWYKKEHRAALAINDDKRLQELAADFELYKEDIYGTHCLGQSERSY